jgi:3-phenylpropionate/trans-cinnamate dioxygenase ferredoxin component
MNNYISAAKLSDVKEGEIFATVVDETPVALTKVDGVVCAFGDICTHDDGPLAEGTIEDGCVVCPRHGAKFNLSTGKQTFPAVTPIPIYETKIVGDEIKVRITSNE